MPGKTHTALFDKCVADVQAKGSADNAYAVCQAALGNKAIASGHQHGRDGGTAGSGHAMGMGHSGMHPKA